MQHTLFDIIQRVKADQLLLTLCKIMEKNGKNNKVNFDNYSVSMLFSCLLLKCKVQSAK
jgi:hypothetical protein